MLHLALTCPLRDENIESVEYSDHQNLTLITLVTEFERYSFQQEYVFTLNVHSNAFHITFKRYLKFTYIFIYLS